MMISGVIRGVSWKLIYVRNLVGHFVGNIDDLWLLWGWFTQTYCILSIAFLYAQELYLCHPSSNPSSGQVYTPNIPDSYFNTTSLSSITFMPARDGFAYFFTLPPRDCNGRVAAIKLCYHAKLTNGQISNGQSVNVFELLMVTRQESTFSFTSRSTIQVTPSASNCVATGVQVGSLTPHDCCTSVTPPNEFQIPSSSFSYGIRIINSNVKPIAFRVHTEAFLSSQFQTTTAATTGNEVTLGGPVRDGILLLRFVIGKCTCC
jgi:hypothetical protein